LPLALLVTPNLPEAERLVGAPAASLAERGELARALGRGGAGAVLLKGAHAPGATIVDLLWDGRELISFAHPRLATRADHGTGCTLSAAIAARLGAGAALAEACGGAIEWLQEALRHAPAIGHGHGPVNHEWERAERAARQ
jgi:hydroxymethylpyrimidine/phosphomethylpyrimidine kinase